MSILGTALPAANMLAILYQAPAGRRAVVNLRGGWKELDAGSWKPGDKSMLKVSVAANSYKLTIEDAALIEIDAINLVRKVGETDQMEAIRAAIGL